MNEDVIKKCVRNILKEIGENPDREGLVDTPDRIIRLYKLMFEGYGNEPRITVFSNKENYDQIVFRKCDFISTCEHHLVIMAGQAFVAYIPDKNIIGLNKIEEHPENWMKPLYLEWTR